MEYIDSSDDEEETIVNEVNHNGYLHYIVNKLINIPYILTQKDPHYSFDYGLGLALQHLADRFFRHTEIGEQYKKLKSAHIKVDKTACDNFIQNAKSFFIRHAELLTTPPSIEDKKVIQLFNHLFTDRVPLPYGIEVINSSSDYKSKLLQDIPLDQDLLRAIQQIFPLQALKLAQSSHATNAAEVLAFCKVINRYIKNDLKVVISSTSSSTTTVDKSIQLSFQSQTIRDLNESWILRPETKKAQNKIVSLGNYSDIFGYINQDNKIEVINHLFNLLNNKDTAITGSAKYTQQTDKLTQLLFISELARNKAAIFTILMFLDLVKEQDISQEYVKQYLINLFPMALKGAMQYSRDLVNESLLKNTHSMDFNHESQTHLNLLKAQGSIYCAYDKELTKIRNLIVLTDKDLRNTISIEDLVENIINCNEFLPPLLLELATALKTHYEELKRQESLDGQKERLSEYFPDKTHEISQITNDKGMKKLITKLFYSKINPILSDFKILEDSISQLNFKLIESLQKLYYHSLKMYGIKGFEEIGKVKLVLSDNTQISEGFKRDISSLKSESGPSKIARSESAQDIHSTSSLQQEGIVETGVMDPEFNLKDLT